MRRISIRSVLALAICVGSSIVASAQGTETRFVIGKIATSVEKHTPRLRALAEYLKPALATAGITDVGIAIYPTVEEMTRALREGRVDLVSETVFLAHELETAGVADMALVEWKGGSPEYHTIFVARADSPIGKIGDFRGKRLAFQDKGSTSGHMLPLLSLQRQSFDVVPDEAGASADDVRYIFTSDEEVATLSAVVQRRADIGVISNLDWHDTGNNPIFYRQQLKIVGYTEPVLRSVTLMRRGVAASLREAVLEALTSADSTDAGRDALKSYFKLKKFERFSEASLALLEKSKRLIGVSAHNQ